MLNNDQLSWKSFESNSELNINNFPSKSEPFNRLIFHSKNFFVIAGYGAFNQGYLMLITKELISSFANINEDLVNEFLWMKNFVKKILKEVFPKYDCLVFEHGMCACLGGLDRAHLHFMPYAATNEKYLVKAINKSLYRRRIGIKACTFEGQRYDNIEDIDIILHNVKDIDSVDIEGHQFSFKDIKSEFNINGYPLNLKVLINQETPYIYFESNNHKNSFISIEHIDTQFGREIAFNLEYNNEELIKKFLDKNNIKSGDDYKFIWRWQDYYFEENILLTIKKIANHVFENYQSIFEKKYNFKSFK